MYNFLFFLYMLISFFLILSIFLKLKLGKNNANDFRNTILGKIEQNHGNSNFLNYIIIFLSLFFLAINLILCNINNKFDFII